MDAAFSPPAKRKKIENGHSVRNKLLSVYSIWSSCLCINDLGYKNKKYDAIFSSVSKIDVFWSYILRICRITFIYTYSPAEFGRILGGPGT